MELVRQFGRHRRQPAIKNADSRVERIRNASEMRQLVRSAGDVSLERLELFAQGREFRRCCFWLSIKESHMASDAEREVVNRTLLSLPYLFQRRGVEQSGSSSGS